MSSSEPEQKLTPRQERAAERILEDERLTAELSDVQARHLVRWASAAAARAAAPGTDEAGEPERLRAITRALRETASVAGGETDPDRLTALADSALVALMQASGATPTPHGVLGSPALPMLGSAPMPALQPAPALPPLRAVALARRLPLVRRRVALHTYR